MSQDLSLINIIKNGHKLKVYMSNDEAKTEIGIRMLCSILGLSPEGLKTNIDIYIRDSSGNKTIIDKRLYSAEDLMTGRTNSRLYDMIMASIVKECNVSPIDITGLTYPDRQTLEPRTLVIEITHHIEKVDNMQQIKEEK